MAVIAGVLVNAALKNITSWAQDFFLKPLFVNAVVHAIKSAVKA